MYQRELFLLEVTNRETIEANNETYCLQKHNRKIPAYRGDSPVDYYVRQVYNYS